jgi:hypothetical protein
MSAKAAMGVTHFDQLFLTFFFFKKKDQYLSDVSEVKLQ